jgi:membrane protein DedA with SNARE-associated domain
MLAGPGGNTLSLAELLDSYGYVALVAGTFLEGETVLVLAGFAAHRGYLSLPWVMLAGFAGSFLGDQLYFYLGRRKGEAFLRRRVTWAPKLERVQGLIERHHLLFILGFRFLYGLRTVSPFAIGMSDVPTRRYVVLNLIGAAVWAAAVAYLGYYLGEAAEALLEQVRRYELGIFAAIAALGMILWCVHFARRSRHRSRILEQRGSDAPG